MSKDHDITFKRWEIKHNAQIGWAMQKIRDSREEAESLKAIVDRLEKQISKPGWKVERCKSTVWMACARSKPRISALNYRNSTIG